MAQPTTPRPAARPFPLSADRLRRALGWWPAALLGALVLIALCAPWLAPMDPDRQNLLARLKAPGFEARGATYVLGSDELGRDVLSRVIYGTRISISVAVLSVLLSGVVGTAVGMAAAYLRGWTETVLMRLVDIFLSIPAILLAIITVAVLGPGFINIILVLALTRWPRYARVAYGQTLAIADRPFVTLARAMGASTPRVLALHILPNIIGPLLVVATLEFGLMVLFEAGLSFLGLGVQPPTASWGAMLSTGRNYIATAWWIATFPGLALFLLVLSANMIGDRLGDLIGKGR
ncbi:ABC transporter permease [Marinibacterium sp. SX1]|uniref:ABC transporter permease n=1 Tax=Marinibacterium sp. SX1 TaxID=3388424 RepID=UPI003D184A28